MSRLTIFLLSICLQLIPSPSETIAPGENLKVSGGPPVPAELARAVKPYTSINGLPLAGWDPMRRELWLKGVSSATWISKVDAPSVSPTM